MKKVSICNGLRTANMTQWNNTLQKYLKTKADLDKYESFKLFNSLGCSSNTSITMHFLELTILENSTFNDTEGAMSSIYRNSDVGVDTVLDFITHKTLTLLIK